MKTCSKCKLEKPDDKFYTYWHSTQNKYRTRRICTDCTDEQKRQYRLKIKEKKEILIEEPIQEEIIQPVSPESLTDLFKDNPDYKLCRVCNTYLLIEDNFYRYGKDQRPQTLCKICHNRKSKQRTREYYEKRRINNGGSERVITKPNKYTDEYQREQTFWIMKLMGWTFDEETGVWWKEGIKDKNKQWSIIKPKPKQQKPQKPKRKIIDINKIIELKKRGFRNTQISDMLDYTQITIRKYLKIYALEHGQDKIGDD